MLPTPSKTPKKRQAAALHSTARVLSFQPNNPNDVFPSPKQVRKHRRHQSLTNGGGFELYEDEAPKSEKIEIFTDANARVPEMDEAEDNPFVGARDGRRSGVGRPQRSSRRRSHPQTDDEARIEEAVGRDEGMVYVL